MWNNSTTRSSFLSRRGISSGCKVFRVLRVALFVDLCTPAGSNPDDLRTLYERHHLPWLRALSAATQPAVTLSLNSWLLQRWLEWGWEEGLECLRTLFDFGQIEVCGTASHHTILPLAPESVAFRQARRNVRLLQQLLSPEWRPAGFYPPQLAYGHELARVLLPLGYRWCLADDCCYAALHGQVPTRHVTRCGELLVVLASRLWSERLAYLDQFSPAAFARAHAGEMREWLGEGDAYQVLWLPATATKPERALEFLQEHRDQGNLPCHISEIVDSFASEEGEVPPGSCRTRVEDFWAGTFFLPWRNGSLQDSWALSEVAIAELEEWQDRLDELLSSHTFEPHASADGLRALIGRLREARS